MHEIWPPTRNESSLALVRICGPNNGKFTLLGLSAFDPLLLKLRGRKKPASFPDGLKWFASDQIVSSRTYRRSALRRHILFRFVGDNFSSGDLGRFWKQRSQILPHIIRSPLV